MRRVLGLVLATSLILALVALPVAADVEAGAGDTVVLAVEGGDLGPDPRPRLEEGNPARELAGYDSPEVPFTWGAAWILTVAGLVGLALLLTIYRLAVRRPRQRT